MSTCLCVLTKVPSLAAVFDGGVSRPTLLHFLQPTQPTADHLLGAMYLSEASLRAGVPYVVVAAVMSLGPRYPLPRHTASTWSVLTGRDVLVGGVFAGRGAVRGRGGGDLVGSRGVTLRPLLLVLLRLPEYQREDHRDRDHLGMTALHYSHMWVHIATIALHCTFVPGESLWF